MKHTFIGILAVLAGGVLNGSFVYPMKKIRRWGWENTWLVYSISGLLFLPWIAAGALVPNLFSVLSAAGSGILTQVFLFGLGWGVGSVLFGIGVARMGLALGYGIILGLLAPVGAFLPMLVLHRDQIWTRQGLALIIGTAIVVGGVVLCAAAGRIRERSAGNKSALAQYSFAAGVVICVLAGVLSPMLNFSFVFGAPLQTMAQNAGSSPLVATNAIWCICLTGGFLVNAGYSAYLLVKNRTWSLFAGAGGRGAWWNAALMGALCFGSFQVYGAGATMLGTLGGIVGWPLFMATSLISSSFLGLVSGEWANTPSRARYLSFAGLATLILAVVVIASGST